MDRLTRIEVTLAAAEMERWRLLAEEVATTPSHARAQLAAHRRQGWPWLLWLDARRQRRALLMRPVRSRGRRIRVRLPRYVDGA